MENYSLPSGVPLSLQVILGTVVLGAIYSILTKDRPIKGFPIITIDGLGPKSSWVWHGRRVIMKGIEQVSLITVYYTCIASRSRLIIPVLRGLPSCDGYWPKNRAAKSICR